MKKNIKECKACGSLFEPTSSTQLYCTDCGSHGLRIKQQYDNQVARSIRYQQLYSPTVFEHTCKVCNKLFKTTYDNRHICSNRCATNASKLKIRCTNCSTPFTDIFELDGIPDNEIYKRNHFCSEQCKQEFEYNKYPERICKQCGKLYRNKNQHFCCRDCQIAYTHTHKKPKTQPIPKRKPTYKCNICNKICAKPIFRQDCQSHTCNIPICSDICLDIYNKQIKQKANEDRNQRLQDYIAKNGMCAICNVSYKDCERMQSDFRIIPKGAKYIDNKIKVCPKFTTKFK